MRGSFYLAIALLGNDDIYSLSDIERNLVFIAYPITELLTVTVFGVMADRTGKLWIYCLSFFITSIALVLLVVVDTFFLLMLATGILGIGVAAKVTTTLALVAEFSTDAKRGRNMGIYDASTLSGLGLGFGFGFLLADLSSNDSSLDSYLGFLAIDYRYVFLVTAILLLILMALVYFGLRKIVVHNKEGVTGIGFRDMFSDVKEVLSDRNMQHLLPIWIPVIALYAIVLANAEELVDELHLDDIEFIFVLGIIFLSILIGFPIQGYLSDKYGRRPFLYIGMISLALFVTLLLLITQQENSNLLFYFSPLLILIGIGCGAFPPAALALLSDVSHKDSLGTSFGSYSIVYGVGLLIGPILAGVSLGIAGLWGLVVVIWMLGVVSILGAWKLPDSLVHSSSHPK